MHDYLPVVTYKRCLPMSLILETKRLLTNSCWLLLSAVIINADYCNTLSISRSTDQPIYGQSILQLIDVRRMIYVDGCADKFRTWLSNRLDVAGAVVLGFTFFEVRIRIIHNRLIRIPMG